MNSPSQLSTSFPLQRAEILKLRICRASTSADLRSADDGSGVLPDSMHEAGRHTEEELPCTRENAT